MSFAQSFKRIYKAVLPVSFLLAKDTLTLKLRYGSLHKTIRGYLRSLEKANSISAEQKNIAAYLENHFLPVFPYPFADKYHVKDVTVLYDEGKKLHYVLWQNKRLYFKKEFTTYDIKRAVVALMAEQDSSSAHRYLTDDFKVETGNVIVDVGAAEGNFTLGVIEQAKKVYLIEADAQWLPALQATFEPWKEKVEIICRFASDKDSSNEISIDAIYKKEGRIDFLKIDTEGSEEKVLNGAMQLIRTTKENLRLALCTYHKQHDADKFSSLLKGLNFNISFSDGYLIFFYDSNQEPPYLRKALIRAHLN